MIDWIFAAKALLSFAVGGAAVAGALLLGEKFGGRIAGIIIGLPVVSALGLFFIGFTQSAAVAAEAVTVMPLTLATGLLFMLSFIKFYERFGLVKSLLASTLLFFLITGIAVAALNLADIYVNAVIYLLALAAAAFLVRDYPEKAAKKVAGKKQFLLRSIFAGTMVMAAVVVAKLANPHLGAIVAAFPASYFSTALISAGSHGVEFTKTIVKGIPPATLGTLLFYFTAYATYPTAGIYAGTVAAYSATLAFVIILEKSRKVIQKIAGKT